MSGIWEPQRSELLNRAPLFLLYLNVLVVATCGLIYELLAGTLASYVLGDSVTQFSLVIGIYLSALGVGAWLSQFVDRGEARWFIEVELAVALVGGLSTPLLLLAFSYLRWFSLFLLLFVFWIGVLVGLELPLLMRILKSHLDFRDLVSRVLTFDYIGALLASLLFPMFLVPYLGLVRTSLIFGAMNAAVGLWGSYLLEPLLEGKVGRLRARAAVVVAVLAAGFIKADAFTTLAEDQQFTNPVLYSQTTPYQRIVVTGGPNDFQLFLNGNLQFSSTDEYRYHEALVHPAMIVAAPSRVLVLGGGDGLAIREILRHDCVKHVTLVDIDPGMVELSERFPPLKELNRRAYDDPRVAVVHADAMLWLEEPSEPFDAVVIDFPDPNNFSLGKLYTSHFYRLLLQHLSPNAAVSIQCTSPFVAPKSFWCIVRTLQECGYYVIPYHATVPSFGVWGFVLAGRQPFAPPTRLPDDLGPKLRFLNDAALQGMFELPADIKPVQVEVNRLDNQRLVQYYDQEWRQ